MDRHPRWPMCRIPFLTILLALALSAGCGRIGGRGEHTALEDRVYSLVNEYRREQGLSALSQRDEIAARAREHSRNMASGRVPPGHAGSDERFADIRKSIRIVAFAENVALNRGYADPARNAVEGWISSPGHRVNMVGDYNLTGVGVAMRSDSTFFITQIYARSQ